MTIRVYLAGEGASELGSRAGDRAYQTDDTPGVLVALLRQVRSDGWKVAGARDWKQFKKLRTGARGHADQKNVKAAALDARASGCDVLVFSRDADNDPDREAAVQEGIELAQAAEPSLRIVGGCAVKAIEAWILAIQGRRRTQDLGRQPAKQAVAATHFADLVKIIDERGLSSIPEDATSLRRWLERAKSALLEQTPSP